MFFLYISIVTYALPRWSWDTLQTYAHFANSSGTIDLPLDPQVAQYFASLPFAVIEKYQGINAEPLHSQAERKIVAAATQLIKTNSSAHPIMYFATDKVAFSFSLIVSNER